MNIDQPDHSMDLEKGKILVVEPRVTSFLPTGTMPLSVAEVTKNVDAIKHFSNEHLYIEFTKFQLLWHINILF